MEENGTGEHIVQLSNMQKVIAKTMATSKQTIPHFYMSIELDFSALLRVKEALKASMPVKVTITPLLMKAVGSVLSGFPMLNAHFMGENNTIITYDYVNMGVATATKRGLSVPVLKDVNGKNLETLVGELGELTQRARIGRSTMDDIKGGTFTLSNAGMFGVTQIHSIIKPPETAILSMGAMTKRPVVIDDQIVIRPIVQAVLSADHRAADGEIGGGFLSALKSLFEAEDRLFDLFR